MDSDPLHHFGDVVCISDVKYRHRSERSGQDVDV